MNRSVKVIGYAITFLVLTLGTQGAAIAANETTIRALFHPNKIVGLWDVEVVVADCNTGEPGGSFRAMHRYDVGGTGQVVPATNPAMLSAHLTVWSHVRRNDYRQTVKFYRFDPTGTAVGWTVIRNEITISQDGTEYMGSGVADFYNAEGDYMFSACPSIIGTRFTGQE